MNRTLLDELLDWGCKPSKPILLTGARQTGKSFLVGKLLASSFSNVAEANFKERPELKACFEDDLTPNNIISRLEALLPCTIVPGILTELDTYFPFRFTHLGLGWIGHSAPLFSR